MAASILWDELSSCHGLSAGSSWCSTRNPGLQGTFGAIESRSEVDRCSRDFALTLHQFTFSLGKYFSAWGFILPSAVIR